MPKIFDKLKRRQEKRRKIENKEQDVRLKPNHINNDMKCNCVMGYRR